MNFTNHDIFVSFNRRRFVHERRWRRIIRHFVVVSIVDAQRLRHDAGRPATAANEPTAAEDETTEDVIQTPPTAHAQILLCHQSQSRRQGLEAALAKDDPLQTCPPGNDTNPHIGFQSFNL